MAIGPGSIAFVGFNADGPDNLAFVVLETIAAGTVIHFTDNEWNGSAFNSGESTWSWTVTSDIAAGTVITMDGLHSSQTASASQGSISYTDATTRDINDSNEVVYAYVGTPSAPTAFLAAIGNDSFSQGPIANTGLVAGQTAIMLQTRDSDADIAIYAGPRAAASFADLLPLINDPMRWITQDGGSPQSGDGTAPDVPFSTAPFFGDPSVQFVNFAATSVSVSQNEGDSATTTITFVVERSGGTSTDGDIMFSGLFAAGTTDAADFGGTLPTFSGVIPAGQASATVSITVTGDISFESDEAFTLTLTDVANASVPVVLGPTTTATGTIVNDDVPQVVSFAAGSLSVTQNEGDDGTVTLTFTVERTGGSTPAGDLDFSGSFIAGTTDSADFPGGLPAGFAGTIPAGASSATVTLTVSGDVALEPNDTFSLALQSVSNPGVPVTIGSNATATGTIVNDDPVPTIAFVGFNADGPDNLAFVALSPITAGSVITFTDNEWNGTAFNSGESVWTWTATSDIAAGTVITMDGLANGQTATSNRGTIAYVTPGSRSIDINNETIYAFAGTLAAPTFLTAIGNDAFGATNGTLSGTGLVEGQTAITLAGIDADADVAAYNGPRGAASHDDLRLLINNPANWIAQDTDNPDNNDGVSPDAPFATDPFVAHPDVQFVSFSAGSLAVSQAEGNSGATTITFVVERSGGTSAAGNITFSGSFTPANVNAADFGGVLPTGFDGTILAGETSTQVTVTVSGDVDIEALKESFTLTLENVSNDAVPVVLGNERTATGTIIDDESVPIIAFTGFAVGTDGGELAFVVLSDLAAGTEISFTAGFSNAWNGESFSRFPTTIGWTATDPVPAGTVVTIRGLDRVLPEQPPTSNIGTAAWTKIGDGRFLSSDTTGTVYAHLGPNEAPTRFLAAVSSGPISAAVLNGTGLTPGVDAIAMTAGATDIAAYVGPRYGETDYTAYLAAINNPANWVAQPGPVGSGANEGNDGIAPDVPLSAAAFTDDLDAQIVGFAESSLTVSAAEGNSGATTLTFTVQRTGGSPDGDLVFSGVIVPVGTTQADDFGGTVPTFSGVIADGQTTATITITVAGDAVFEPAEKFLVQLTSLFNSGETVLLGERPTAAVTITNDDVQTLNIAVVGFDGAQNDGDDAAIAFVALDAIPAGTVIHFTTKGWTGSDFSGEAFNSNSMTWSWTATSDVAAGSVITVEGFAGGSPTSNLGTILLPPGQGALYSNSIVYAYIGEPDRPTAFLTAFATTNFGFAPAGPGTLAGTGLTAGVNAVAIGSAGTAVYVGPRTGEVSLHDYLADIHTASNWLRDGTAEASENGTAPDAPLPTLSFVAGAAQTVGFAAGSASLTATEGDSGTMTFTFTIERSGGTTGAVAFTGRVLPNLSDAGATANADDFGGSYPTFSGTIAEGQTSATVTIEISGDALYEATETFALELLSISNSAGAPVGAGTIYAKGTIANDDGYPTTIHAGEVVNAPIAVTGNDHLVVEEGGSLIVDPRVYSQAITWEGTGTDVVIDNSGALRGGRVLSAPSGTGGDLTINNMATGVIEGEIIPSRVVDGTLITINNYGWIGDAGRVMDFHDATTPGTVIINNFAGATITQTANGVDDMIRPGENTIINNAGTIIMAPGHAGGGDAIDFKDDHNGVVNNLAGGLIEASRHAVTGDAGVHVYNEGTLIGRNGSAVNIDNNGTEAERAFVINHGNMEGRSAHLADSDGDAVDIDGLLTLENYGRIAGMGHNGYHDGEPNVSEGLAIGGGTVTNYGEIYGYGRAIQVDNSSNANALGKTTIVNFGVIHGDGNVPTDVTPEEVELFRSRIIGGEAINLLGTYADEITNAGVIGGGVKMGGGDDTLSNWGDMAGTGGSAIDLGEGNDTLNAFAGGSVSAANGPAINLGAGDDTLNLWAGAVITGDILGGDGSDTVRLLADEASTIGSLGVTGGFENLVVDQGTWSVAGGENFGAILVKGGATVNGPLGVAGTLVVEAGATVQDEAHAIVGGDSAVSIFNAGRIDGDHQGGVIVGFSLGGDEAVGLIGDHADSLLNTGTIVGGVSMGGGNDTLTNSGSMTATGGAAIDMGDGDDRVDNLEAGVLAPGGGVISGEVLLGAGNDSFSGNGTDETVDGGTGNDVLIGGGGDDTLKGGADDDHLFGGTGDDRLDGGAGNDVLGDGEGLDLFVFNPGYGQDQVYGFAAGEDVIELSAAEYADYGALVASGALTDLGGTTQIAYEDGSTLQLVGVSLASLTADDFRFV